MTVMTTMITEATGCPPWCSFGTSVERRRRIAASVAMPDLLQKGLKSGMVTQLTS
jgi:hypothetical protein